MYKVVFREYSMKHIWKISGMIHFVVFYTASMKSEYASFRTLDLKGKATAPSVRYLSRVRTGSLF